MEEGYGTPPPGWSSYINSITSVLNNQHPHPTTTPSASTGYSPTSTSSSPTYTSSSKPPPSLPDTNPNDSLWERLSPGAKAGIVVAGCIIILLITVASTWFCCGCCGYRRRRARNREINNPRPDTDTVPLRNTPPQTQTQFQMQAQPQTFPLQPQVQTRGGGGGSGLNRGNSTATLPPPLYTEYTPPQHTTIAGGITHVREEEEGVISDGKMPLSEMAFEDVVLSHSNSHSGSEGSLNGGSSEARNFHGTHRGYGGDVTGHTNS